MYWISSYGQLQGVVLQFGGGEGLKIPCRKEETACYEMLHRDSELDGFFRLLWTRNLLLDSLRDGKFPDKLND
jgi:hypothetical protein